MWGGVAIFVVFASSWCFLIATGYIVANHPMSIKQAKKTCIRPFDTNNFTQSLTRKYDHTATKSLYRLCDEKFCWTPTLVVVFYQFGFVSFPICLQCKISGSSFFTIFSNEFSCHKVRKVTDPNFWKYVQIGLAWRT